MKRFALVAVSTCLLGCVHPGRPPALHYLATADQVGPVAYRDPLGAISPDGAWLAYTERDRVKIAPVGGGPVQVVGPGTASIRHLSWLPDSRRLAVRERGFDRSGQRWFVYDRTDRTRTPLWPNRTGSPALSDLGQLCWSHDGQRVAGVARTRGGWQLWTLAADGSGAELAAEGERLSFPAWSPDGRLAYLSIEAERQTLRFVGGARFDDIEAYGPVAFSADGDTVYFGSPGEGDFLELCRRPASGGPVHAITHFARDAYAPSAGRDGRVVFKTQDYRVFLATAPAGGGPVTPLTTFQSETPSWSWDGRTVAFTFGSWRHVTDDFHYPDIAQHLGVVNVTNGVAHAEPERIVRQSYSEDQGMHWSPNGKWIAFHTHVESDDIWLMRADGTGTPRMISSNGSETGWPRWSRDGRWVVFPSYRRDPRGARQAHLFIIGIDQDTGEITEPQRRIEMPGFEHDVVQGEWLDDGETLVFEAAEAISRKSLWTVPRAGGSPAKFHEFSSEQVHSGIGVSSDGSYAAYIDRADDGFFQVFRVPVAGGEPEQMTRDPSHKTQPAYSPTGDRIAFTVFSYRVHFWSIWP